MIKVLLFDLARVLLFPKDVDFVGELNKRHTELSQSSNYNFPQYFKLDDKALDYVKNLKDKYRLFIFTSGTIQNVPEIKNALDEVFENIYSAYEIGLRKTDPNVYRFLAEEIGVKPSEILFIDDTKENTDAAIAAELNAVVYKNLDDFKDKLKKTETGMDKNI